jgi:hypothetical protein
VKTLTIGREEKHIWYVLICQLWSIRYFHSISKQVILSLHLSDLRSMAHVVVLDRLFQLGDFISCLLQLFLLLLQLPFQFIALEIRKYSGARTI